MKHVVIRKWPYRGVLPERVSASAACRIFRRFVIAAVGPFYSDVTAQLWYIHYRATVLFLLFLLYLHQARLILYIIVIDHFVYLD